MSFNKGFIVLSVFLLGVSFLVLSIPEDSRARAIPAESDCCSEHGEAGCDNVVCEDIVCGNDPFCCDDTWDGECVEEAEQFCDVCGGSPAEPIPTLNQWGLIALAGMMGLAALYIIIRRNPLKSN